MDDMAFVPGAALLRRSSWVPSKASDGSICSTNGRGCMQRARSGGRRRVELINGCANANGDKGLTLTIEPEAGKDFYGIPNPGAGGRLLLSDLRERLIRQEETIIFALIERAQFNENVLIYKPEAFSFDNDNDTTFLDYLLRQIESTYATVRRYTSPDEHAFTPAEHLAKPILPGLKYPGTLLENDININPEIKAVYIREIIPKICAAGDDNNYGSSAANDVLVLQALSKRIHYGKFIAEAKLQEDFDHYLKLAAKNDTKAIYKLLSDQTVEDVLLRRVENKARNYGRDVNAEGRNRDVYKVRPQLISKIYRDYIIPLTKQVEIDYILFRCHHHTKNNS